ncbi:MAG: sodium:alanine symporter [Haloplasmataceae bacterium]|jgi:AGCS family alanine or glycine:cation symporter|nr:sodium:alanine symporter [Haloplasmataceae bacterium]
MEKFESILDNIVEKIIWGWPLIIILLLMGIYFTVKTRFVQLRYLLLMPKLMFQKSDDDSKITPFQTISLILANHVGTGNIIGVSIAIMYGGPGAVFWMWVTAIIGSALSFVENTLGQMYKVEVNNEYRGGPAYYIAKGLKSPFWAHVIAFVFLICLGLMMPTIQSAAISTTLNFNFSISKYIIGLVVTFTLAIIIIGNSKKIVVMSEIMVPIMAFFYLFISFIVILININKLDDVFMLIINNALNKNAFFGSIIGSAISFGVRRGLFSHEAGLGSSPNISASANVKHPVHQGLISAFCVFIDTILICSATAIMIFITDSYNVVSGNKFLFTGLVNVDSEQYVQYAIDTVFKNLGAIFVSISIFFFAYASLIGGFFNAQSNIIFLFKKEKQYKIANKIYKIVFLLIILLSSIFDTRLAWKFTDIGIGIASLLHLFVLFLLRNKVIDSLKDFEVKYKKKDNSRYVNEELDCWKK